MPLSVSTSFPLLSISYANYVQQYLQTICFKNIWRKKNTWCSDSSFQEKIMTEIFRI